ncbi:MAG: hypothetical protein ACO1TE_09800 [Prosthecobacter sp.]
MKSRTIVLTFVVLVLLAGGLFWFVTKDDLPLTPHPLPAPPKRATAAAPPKPAPTVVTAAPEPPAPPPRDRRAIDPEIQKLADRLADHTQTPLNDLEIVHEFFDMYRKTMSQLPVGSNEDLTAILTGRNPLEGVLFPADSPMIVNGQIVDRWGSPYWLHPNSGARVEIRSAGPDKSLFTPDDVILNASPGGFGATPGGAL